MGRWLCWQNSKVGWSASFIWYWLIRFFSWLRIVSIDAVMPSWFAALYVVRYIDIDTSVPSVTARTTLPQHHCGQATYRGRCTSNRTVFFARRRTFSVAAPTVWTISSTRTPCVSAFLFMARYATSFSPLRPFILGHVSEYVWPLTFDY